MGSFSVTCGDISRNLSEKALTNRLRRLVLFVMYFPLGPFP